MQEALETDPEFYRFLRRLESYENSIQEGATLILSGEEGSYLGTLVSGPPKARKQSGPPLPPPQPTEAREKRP